MHLVQLVEQPRFNIYICILYIYMYIYKILLDTLCIFRYLICKSILYHCKISQTSTKSSARKIPIHIVFAGNTKGVIQPLAFTATEEFWFPMMKEKDPTFKRCLQRICVLFCNGKLAFTEITSCLVVADGTINRSWRWPPLIAWKREVWSTSLTSWR